MSVPAPTGSAASRAGSGSRGAGSRPGACVPALAALALLAALLTVPTGVSAQDRDTPNLSLDAFGTLGLVYSSEDDADFAANQFRADGAGHTKAVSPEVDSRLGGQITAFLTPKLTAVVQLVAEQDHEDRYVPSLEWAYLDYAFTPEFSVRAGRMPVGTFMVSEFRKVSFANPWIRPPPEVYTLGPIASGEEIEASYSLRTGDWTNTLELGYGRAEVETPNGEVETEKGWNVSNTVQRGAFTGRALIAGGELTIDGLAPLFDAFREFGPAGAEIAERYEVDDTPLLFASLGAEYDPGPWFGMAELGWADFNSVLGEKLAGYVTAGHRFGAVTPHVTYARVEALSETSADGLTVGNLPPELAGPAGGLNEALDTLLGSTAIQQSVTLGARWDFTPGMALKGEIQFVDFLEESPGTFINEQPGFERGGSAQLVSLATVFVF